jgi:hypothetical protein
VGKSIILEVGFWLFVKVCAIFGGYISTLLVLIIDSLFIVQGVPVLRLLGTRFIARNCINEHGPQEPFRDIFTATPCRSVIEKSRQIF